MASPHIIVDLPPPPPFQPYDAELFRVDDGDIVSHDHHLNSDGEALYRFIVEQAAVYPKHLVHCRGSHTETRQRQVRYTTSDGHTRTRVESYTVTIIDFNFSIDFSAQIVTGPVHWSLADSEPAYRGLMVRQVQAPTGRRKATKTEISDFKLREDLRAEKGLPPWIDPDGTDHLSVLQSSQTMRQWADEYCASPKYLKEFTYEKFVHGWDLEGLKAAIHDAICGTGYSGNISVKYSLYATKICIRPDNRLSRALSKKFIKYLLIVFLIYPFIWLFKRYSSRGGGRWEVCGGAYALKHIEPVEPDPEDKSVAQAGDAAPRIIDSADGPVKIVGLREGEWFRIWEPVIKHCVVGRLQQSEPMTQPINTGSASPAAVALDGY